MNTSSENDIDDLLAALRQTEPSPGFEQRLIASVEQAKEQPPRRRLWFVPMAVAGACAAALILHLAQTGRHVMTPTAPAVMAQAPVPATPAAQNAATARPLFHSPRTASTQATAPQPVESSQPLTDDQLAAAQTAAPSKAAPAMPLTAQERVLLRAARRNDNVDLAQLDTPPRPEFSQEANVTRYLQRNFASMAFAEAFHPTPAVEAPRTEAPQPQAEASVEAPQ